MISNIDNEGDSSFVLFFLLIIVVGSSISFLYIFFFLLYPSIRFKESQLIILKN